MKKSVFEFSSYKVYLHDRVGAKHQRRGLKSAIAQALQCQPTYVSQVLNGDREFSPEQAEMLSRFLDHSKDEALYFMLLVQRERAGTKTLRDFVQAQIDELLSRRLNVKERLGERKALTPEQQSTYYSSWHYAAIHIALTIPELRTSEALARYFRIPPKKVTEVLEFLVQTDLATSASGQYETGHAQIRLGNDSTNILKHHTHWRTQAIESLDRERVTDLHYSAVVSLSRQDAVRIKDRILEEIKAHLSVIQESKEEVLYCYSIDFFSMNR